MNKLLFIGPLEHWNSPTNGESAKNQLLLKRLQSLYDKVIVIDTQDWKKSPFCLLKLFGSLVFLRNTSVIISACDVAAYKLIKFLDKIRLKKNVCYVVIGGGLADCIKEESLSTKHYRFLKKIIVEGEPIKQALQKLDSFENVMVVPNLKPNFSVDISDRIYVAPVRFVFLSRIEPTKGCDVIFEACEKLNKKGYSDKYTVDFFGRIDSTYEIEFMHRVEEAQNISYKGVLNLSSVEGYNVLKNYHTFLFPTFYFNEGFPGVLVDAFISGLPIIATKWHLNSDIVKEGYTGFLIEPNSSDSLVGAMEIIINEPSVLKQFAINSRQEANKYDVNIVWNNQLLKEIGI